MHGDQANASKGEIFYRQSAEGERGGQRGEGGRGGGSTVRGIKRAVLEIIVSPFNRQKQN